MDALVVGSEPDRSLMYAILAGTGEVIVRSRHDPATLKRWDSFGEMLVSEVERFAPLCDEAGRVAEYL